MLSRILPPFLLGVLSFTLHIINTLFWFVPIIVTAFIKFLLPIALLQKIFTGALNFFATSWISVNSVIIKMTKPIQWNVTLPKELSTKDWYLVVANHQSWVDILALQQVLNGKIPFLKFFLKQELLWVPILGAAWWALDFPFMKRYTKSYIKKNPHKKGQDFKTTQKACKKFKTLPISVMNFAEGTRFTQAKHASQNSPFKHLLKPKSGGIGYVLTLMGDEVKQVLNVTINYPENHRFSFWDFMCGKVRRIDFHAELVTVPDEVKGSYIENPETRKATQRWINELWQEKDKQLIRLKQRVENEK